MPLDTKSYWALSRNIYRYGHIGRDHVKHGVHTVNEGKTQKMRNALKCTLSLTFR